MRQKLLFIFALLCSFATWAEHYQIYFANQKRFDSPEQVRVHAWNTQSKSVTAWDNNPSMKHSEMAVKLSEGAYYDLYTYEFDLEGTPQGIIFRHSGYDKGQSADLPLVNGAIYVDDSPKTDLETLPLTHRSFYFADTDGCYIPGLNFNVSQTLFSTKPILGDDARWYTTAAGESVPAYECAIMYLPDGFNCPALSVNGSEAKDVAEGALYLHTASGGDVKNAFTFSLEDKQEAQTCYFYDPSTSDYNQVYTPCKVEVSTGDAVAVTNTGRYVVGSDNERHILYQCDFTTSAKFPANILFNGTAKPYRNGAVYALDSYNIPSDPAKLLREYTAGDAYCYTFYFADIEGWGAANTRLHAWGVNDQSRDYVKFDFSPYLTDTHKLVRIKDMFYPCYTISLTTAYPLTHTQWRQNNPTKQSDNFSPVADGQLFWFSDKQITPINGPHELVDGPAPEQRKIYFHTGANEVLSPGLWEQACAHFYRKGEAEPTLADLTALYNAGTEKMTRLEEGMWATECDNIHDYYDVGFYYLNKISGEVKEVFRASSAGDNFDPTEWSRYVFDIGISQAYQSYMTPEQYDAMVAEPGNALYIAGNRAIGFPDDNFDLRNCEQLDYDNGIYMREIVAGSQDNPAMFKLSFVDVPHYAATANAADNYKNQRGWATFNLNLVGAETRGYDWIVRDKNTPTQNYAIYTPLNNSLPYNKFNQNEWCISSREDLYPDRDRIQEGNTYYLIIDTHPADRSVSLVSFNPRPSVEISDATIDPVQLDYASLMPLHSGEEFLAKHNGEVYFDCVNVASGLVKITPAATAETLTHNHYTVKYTVMAGDMSILTHDGNPGADGISVPYLPLGDDIALTVRARYTNTDTKISFCSLTGAGAYVELPELAAPEVSVPFIDLLPGTPGDDCPEGHFALSLSLTYPYSVGTRLAYLPDYDLASPYDGSQFSFNNSEIVPFDADDSDAPYSDANNWAKKISTDMTLPLIHKNVGYVDAATSEIDGTLDLTAYAVYPFLVRDNALVTDKAANAPARAPLAAPSGCKLIFARTSTTHQLSTHFIMTGLNTLRPDADSPAEYYDLQGRRTVPSTPGIYILRQGTTTRKVYIK